MSENYTFYRKYTSAQNQAHTELGADKIATRIVNTLARHGIEPTRAAVRYNGLHLNSVKGLGPECFARLERWLEES